MFGDVFGKKKSPEPKAESANPEAESGRPVEELQTPLTFDDATFGRFTLNQRVNRFEGEVLWGTSRVRLLLNVEEDRTVIESLAHAHSLHKRQGFWDAIIGNHAAEELLPRWNKDWRQEIEPEIHFGEFRARMKLNSITVHPNGRVEFWYDNNGLFQGRAIVVRSSLTANSMEVSLEE